jgi:NAD(P)H-hydrate epimerase
MKILTVEQIRQLDEFTIKNEPVTSIELMERAARTFIKWFTHHYPDKNAHIHIFCGSGNNGGDGLAIARMLSHEFYEVHAYILNIGTTKSHDFLTNLKNLKKHRCRIESIESGSAFPKLNKGEIAIDAIFGSGLNKPVTGYWEELIRFLNESHVTKVSVDIPSGMFADTANSGTSIHAHRTLSFEMPKLGFMFPENSERVGLWEFESIGLSHSFIDNAISQWHFTLAADIRNVIKRRTRHQHKGNFGHALLIAGGFGKVGSALLATEACLRSGAGLVSVHAPQCATIALQSTVPEAMYSSEPDEKFFATLPEKLEQYSSIGIGCGLGKEPKTLHALENLLEALTLPLVIDADALNLISENPSLISKVPPNSILTPHPKEFERLFGTTQDSLDKHRLLTERAVELQLYIVLKGAYTAVATPDGNCHFNSSGNPGMATGGSGDVLTGMLTGLLAQGYSPLDTCLLGVYLHGLAGDLAAEAKGIESMIAGDITQFIGKAYAILKTESSN